MPFVRLVVVTIIALTFSVQVGAQDARRDDDWSIHLGIDVWFAGARGVGAVDGVVAPFDFDPHDMIDFTEFSGIAHAEMRWREWRFIAKVAVMVLDEGVVRGGVASKADMEELYGQGAVAYAVPQWSLRPSSTYPRLTFEPLLGVRYSRVDLRVSLMPPGTVRGKRLRWGEIFVGGRLGLAIARKWSWTFDGDAGGFGLGGSSDLAWTIATGVYVRPWSLASFGLGYRVYDVDYNKGGQSAVDHRFHGPTVTLVFHL